jgi:hypothetical protein
MTFCVTQLSPTCYFTPSRIFCAPRRDALATENTQNPRRAARAAHRRAAKVAARVARKTEKCEARQAARQEARAAGAEAAPAPAQLKLRAKRISARLAHLRMKLNEVVVERHRVQARREEVLAAGATEPAEGGGGAPEGAQPPAKCLEEAKRALKLSRCDARLARIEVKAQKFVRAWGLAPLLGGGAP